MSIKTEGKGIEKPKILNFTQSRTKTTGQKIKLRKSAFVVVMGKQSFMKHN